MNNKLLKPDYLFEASWEVCNKIGGIHTVLSTKALTMTKEFGDNLIFIGPDVWREAKENPEFIQDDSLFEDWRCHLADKGIMVRTGRWNIIGKPVVILVDFTSFIPEKDSILAKYWELYQVDSISGGWDYVEALLFGHAAGIVVESFFKFYLDVDNKVVAGFHEWMTGAGALYLKKYAPHIGTVFTTHATTVGRSIAGNGLPLYDHLNEYDGDSKARELNVVSKHSLEKNSAIHSDCFTTVSEITAKECSRFLYKEVDVITPNGFEETFVPKGKEFENKRNASREKLRTVAEALLGYKLSDNTLFISNSGRYEFRNKGIDVFMDALKHLNDSGKQNREIVAYVMIPANTYGPRKDLIEKLNNPDSDVVLDNPFLTHGLHDIGYDPIINKIQQTHLSNDKEDRVKLIFVPSYLNGDDGIFNMHYYDILIGMDLTVFPSYYEPWGYTPVESLAFHIPTITTDLAGFGLWVKKIANGIDEGVAVIHRDDVNNHEAALDIAGVISQYCSFSTKQVEKSRARAKEIAGHFSWDELIKYYYEAYDISLKAVDGRRDKINIVPKNYRIKMKPETSPYPVWKKIIVKSKLPDNLKFLHELSRNLWWTWNYQALQVFEMVDHELWMQVEKNPVVLLEEVTLERIDELSKDTEFVSKLKEVEEMFRSYMSKPGEDAPSIAYFSMEYGLTNVLKIYSGGLGILAGDYLKEASDCGVNMTAVGFLYRYGYFRQSLSLNGEQIANYDPQEFSNLPLERVRDAEGKPMYIQVDLPGRTVNVKVWKAQVGRVPLYLLDSDCELNSDADRSITHTLYGGDWENRLKQEILLGFGGIRLLDKLGVSNDLFHLNEGHAAFTTVQRLINLVNNDKFNFNEAMEIVRTSSLFTTHTPVPAGHDKFDEDMLRIYLRHVPEKLNISWEQFMDMGREHPGDQSEKFSMSILAAKCSQEMNGVSWLHGEVTKKMFKNLWKGFFPEELHIGYVTNGVHYGTWTASEMRELYETFDENFLNDLSNKEIWKKIYDVSDEKLWELRNNLRKKLFNYLKDRIKRNMPNLRENPGMIMDSMEKMDDKVLTIGFARRFATYKRAHLLFTDEERLSRIVNNPERPVQFIFAGKAHPADGGGQALIKRIVEISRRPEFIGKIIFVEDYNMDLAKRLISGVDVWMNTPTRPLEASGTSGQKAELNGVLNFSVLDGWWYEGYREGAGWALTDKRVYENQQFQDELDAANIYSILENEIIPLFYDTDKKGVPAGWIRYVKNSIAQIAPDYTTKRMLDDYRERFYNKQYQRVVKIRENDYEGAVNIAEWKRRVAAGWDKIEVVSVEIPDIAKKELGVGDDYVINVVLDKKDLKDIEIGLEMVFTEGNTDNPDDIKMISAEPFELVEEKDGKAHYTIKYKLKMAGLYNFGIRMYPKHPALPHKQDFGLMRWI
ncbi:MAG: alpha-glucan family phosphorylase [Chlorobi bacterium]|nr:alpha-glucan family phosphorylase [Chlorobiota bacterium]